MSLTPRPISVSPAASDGADRPELTGRAPHRREQLDAVVVGGGHHGLVAATLLADRGWDVVLLEARPKVGGAISSVVESGPDGEWVMDEFSACHPLAVASPVLAGLGLHDHGLTWSHAPRPVAHVGAGDDPLGAAVESTPQATAAGLVPGDAAAWLRLCDFYARVREPLLDAILTQWPPTTSAARLLGAVGLRDVPDFVRFLMLPAHRMVDELFVGDAAKDLVMGNAMHADIPPTAPGSGLFGWLMTMLAQDVGFPSAAGGTRRLAEALESRARAAGVDIRTGVTVDRIVVAGGRAVGVETADGRQIAARRCVIADASAPGLYRRLLPSDAVPTGLSARLERFEWDLPTVKLNYRLAAPMPWRAERARGAGVVHAGLDHRGVLRWSADLEAGTVPDRVFALVGQMSTIDASRSPQGTEALWLYTHAPRGRTDDATALLVADRSEEMFDDLAPGWRELILDRWVQRPSDLAAANANLGDGAVGGGTMQLFQQAVWRPVTGLGGPYTHVDGLFHASAAVHPGGGVHGGAGHLAAMAALREAQWWSTPGRALRRAALQGLYRQPPAVGAFAGAAPSAEAPADAPAVGAAPGSIPAGRSGLGGALGHEGQSGQGLPVAQRDGGLAGRLGDHERGA